MDFNTLTIAGDTSNPTITQPEYRTFCRISTGTITDCDLTFEVLEDSIWKTLAGFDGLAYTIPITSNFMYPLDPAIFIDITDFRVKTSVPQAPGTTIKAHYKTIN